jgi:hypothetical protein
MSRVTFEDFFGTSVDGFWKDVQPELTSALKGNALAQLPQLRPSLLSGITDKAKELFDVDVVSVIVATWSKYRELAKYADPEKYPAAQCNLVPLAKHTLTVSYHPYLELLFNGQPLGQIVFDITLSLELEGFVLTIQNGRIMKVQTGSCQGKGKIAYKDHVLMEKALTKITLAGTLDLGEGISLRRGDDKRKQGMKVLSRSRSAAIEPESSGVGIAPEEANIPFTAVAI